MDEHRQQWNAEMRALPAALKHPAEHAAALALFLRLHAAVHSGQMTAGPFPSFEDAVWEGWSDAQARITPPGMQHSIAWITWHLTRCEDITFNILVAGCEQVLHAEGWLERTAAPIRDTGNTLDLAAVDAFSAAVDLPALRAYRVAVGRRTREIVQSLPPGSFPQPVDAARAPRIIAEGAVAEGAYGLVDYWASRTIGGLLAMPATRHPMVHWSEAFKVKKKIGLF